MNAISTSTSLARGELVEVCLTGKIAELDSNALVVRVASGDGSTFSDVEIPTEDGQRWGINIKRVAPVEWPPRAGDVWKDATSRAWWFYHSENTPESLTRRNAYGSYEEKVDPSQLLEQGPWTLALRTTAPFDEEPPF